MKLHKIACVQQAGAVTALDAQVREFIEASKATATKRAYATDFADFERYCEGRGQAALPAFSSTVAEYIAYLAATKKPATIQRRLASISVGHQATGFESPTSAPLVRTTMQGIRRTVGVAQRQAAPLLVEHMRQVICIDKDSRKGIRDHALLLLGLAGAFRRSELVALDVTDLDFRPEGMVITLRRSKTNQSGEIEQKDIGNGRHEATCPVRTVRAWLHVAGITEGAVFRPIARSGEVLPRRLNDRAVARIVKAAAERIGLDPAAYSGHSLRAGLVTEGYRAGIAEIEIMRTTGHNSRATLARYEREGRRFSTDISGRIGL